jgi:hypothetical protein
MTTETITFTNREALNQYLDAHLKFAKTFEIEIKIIAKTMQSYVEMLPEWKTTDTFPIQTKFNLYDQILQTSLLAQETATVYTKDIHGHILQSLILCHGFIPTMEYLRYRLSLEKLYKREKTVAFLQDDIQELFQKHTDQWASYKAYLDSLVTPAIPTPPAPAPSETQVKKYLAHNTFHLRHFGYHIGQTDDAVVEPLRRAVATHGKDKVLCKLYFLLSVYTDDRSPSHRALQRDITIVSSL